MKSGGPWRFRGLRPREAARPVAQQPDVSLGEWLNSVVQSADDDGIAGESRERRPPPENPPHRERSGAAQRYEGRPYRDDNPADREERRDRDEPRRDSGQNFGGQNDDPQREAERDEFWRAAHAREQARHDEEQREAAHEEARREAQREQARHAAEREEARREEASRARAREDLSEVNARLDELTQQLDRLADAQAARRQRAATARLNEPPEPRKPALTEAPPRPRRTQGEPVMSIEDAVVEIAARQRVLDAQSAAVKPATAADVAPDADAAPPATSGPKPVSETEAPAATPMRSAALDAVIVPATAPVAPTIDLSNLEGQLRELTARVEALQPAGDIDKAIAAVRSDLADIGRQLGEALPRRALESLEIEVKALGERIDHSRQCGVDPSALASLERGLNEVRDALRALTPAENLVGYDETVKTLSQKLEAIPAGGDPSALQQLEAAIGGLRGIVSHVASNDALSKLAEDVRALASQVDRIANATFTGPDVSALEQRIGALAGQLDGIANTTATGHAVSALEQRIDTLAAALTASSEAGQAVPRDLEKLLGGLIEKLEWVQLTHTDHAALAHLEDRIAALVQRFDASDARLGHLEAIERGLADLLVHIEEIRGKGGIEIGAALEPPGVQAIERDVAKIKQSERRTQDSLEAVQGTVEHLVDRLATIESSLHRDPAPRPEPAGRPLLTREPAPEVAPREVESADHLDAAASPSSTSGLAESAVQRIAAARLPIDPTLPPDHPLEPGSTSSRSRPPSAAERIAESEAAIGSAKPPVISDAERPNFIAAARRAAQAAAWEPPRQRPKAAPGAEQSAAQPSKLSQYARKLIVGASVVLILVGCIRIATKFFEGANPGTNPPTQPEQTVPPPAPPPQASVPPKQLPSTTPSLQPPNSTPSVPPSTMPAPSPTKPGRQSMRHPDDETAAAAVTPPSGEQPGTPAIPSWATPDITGALPLPPAAPNVAPTANAAAAVADHKLPPTIGNPALRKAAMAGDPAAAYEVAIRFIDGRGVLQNNEEAAYWLQRAAKAGLTPAQFRLGGLYEKGLGVKKDLAVARDLYLAAAEKGNGNAMHNLAVLYAEGVNAPPDYSQAAVWFRKAADHGIRDSQYNLGILYARGIGVGQNNAESYKWFALAANEGDKDAAKKRDEIASRLDPQSLAEARLAVQKWRPEPQADDAISVKTSAAWASPAEGARAANPQ